MKKYLILLFALLAFTVGNSQIFEPIKWSTSIEKFSDTEYNLVSKATIESGWHLYSQNVPQDGPIATVFTFNDAKGAFKFTGKIGELEGKTEYDSIFKMRIKFFEKSAIFVQRVQVLGDVSTVNATVEFMACDDTRCLPPVEENLIFNLPKKKKKKKKKK